MRRMLLKRREVWVPTVWGWLVLLGIVVLALAAAALGAYPFLAPTAPAHGADGRGAKVLVVEGWIEDDDLDDAVRRFRQGGYERVITTGGPMTNWSGQASPWPSWADRGAAYLASHGLAGVRIDAVPAPASAQERTFLSAVVLREWAARSGQRLDAIDLYTAGVHARRSRRLFELALGPGTEVGVIANRPHGWEPQRWWRTSIGARLVVGEAIGWAWAACCFWPPAPGSHEERWAEPPPAAARPGSAPPRPAP